VTQDATTDEVLIKLDQVPHVSYVVRDFENTVTGGRMLERYAVPAGIALAEKIDRILLGQVYRFRSSRVPGTDNQQIGQLNGLTSGNVNGTMLAARRRLIENNQFGIYDLHVSPAAEEIIQSDNNFVTADKIGDSGEALRNATLGRLRGFNIFLGTQVPHLNLVTGEFIDGPSPGLLSAAVAGATTVVLAAGDGPDHAVGQHVTFPGVDGASYQITAIATDTLTLDVPLRFNLATTQIVRRIEEAAVDNGAGYAVGYAKTIAFDGTGVPKVGQMVSFGLSTVKYAVVDVSGSTMELDRPLEVAISDDDVIGLGASGGTNLAMSRGAFTFVNRPLVPAMTGAGAISASDSLGGLSVRTTVGYDMDVRQHRVTMDLAFGVQVMEANGLVPLLS
jgi:hypothetical protein